MGAEERCQNRECEHDWRLHTKTPPEMWYECAKCHATTGCEFLPADVVAEVKATIHKAEVVLKASAINRCDECRAGQPISTHDDVPYHPAVPEERGSNEVRGDPRAGSECMADLEWEAIMDIHSLLALLPTQ